MPKKNNSSKKQKGSENVKKTRDLIESKVGSNRFVIKSSATGISLSKKKKKEVAKELAKSSK